MSSDYMKSAYYNLMFSDDYTEWETKITKYHMTAIIKFDEDSAFRAFVGERKVGCFDKLPGHGFYYKR